MRARIATDRGLAIHQQRLLIGGGELRREYIMLLALEAQLIVSKVLQH